MTEPLPEPRMLVLREDAGEIAMRRGVNNPPADTTQPVTEQLENSRWQRIDLTDNRYATPPTPPDLHPLIYSGLRHALSGPPEATKTLLSYAILLDIVRAGRTVAIVDFEMGANRARILLDDLGATRDDLARIHYHQDVEGPPSDHDIAQLEHAQVALVLIDSSVGAFDASGLDDNARKDVEAWAKAWIRPLFTRGIATLVLDHVTKNADTRGKFTIGSERKTGGVDVHLGAEPVGALRRGGQAIVKIRTHKDRGAFLERPHACIAELSSHPDTHSITVTLKPSDSSDDEGHFRPTRLMQAVSRYLEIKGAPASRTNIVENVKGNTDYKRAAIDALVREGFLAEQDGARGAREVVLRRPYREDDDPAQTPPDSAQGGVTYDPASPPPSTGGAGRGHTAHTTPTPPDEDDLAFIHAHEPMPLELLEDIARTEAHHDPTDQ